MQDTHPIPSDHLLIAAATGKSKNISKAVFRPNFPQFHIKTQNNQLSYEVEFSRKNKLRITFELDLQNGACGLSTPAVTVSNELVKTQHSKREASFFKKKDLMKSSHKSSLITAEKRGFLLYHWHKTISSEWGTTTKLIHR